MLQRVHHPGTRTAERLVRAPRGTTLSAKSWLTEAPLRMLMNNLDPEVAENPRELVVYGGIGRAPRHSECFHAIVPAPQALQHDGAPLIQTSKTVGGVQKHPHAAR